MRDAILPRPHPPPAVRIGRPYREKTLVLCFYEYTGRSWNTTVRLTDSIMIKVEFSDQIHEEFNARMRQIAQQWEQGNVVGPRPLEWFLLRYQTANGRKNF